MFSESVKVGCSLQMLLCFYLIYKIGPKKSRKNVMRIETPTDTQSLNW